MCKECSSKDVKCYCHDVGNAEHYHDEYVLYCHAFGSIDQEHKYGGSVYGEEYNTYCSWCLKPQNEHEPPPDEIFKKAAQ